MYKAKISYCGSKITKTGETPEECLRRLQEHLKTFFKEDHYLTYRPADLFIFIDCGDISIGKITKILPASCE